MSFILWGEKPLKGAEVQSYRYLELTETKKSSLKTRSLFLYRCTLILLVTPMDKTVLKIVFGLIVDSVRENS